LLYKFSEVEVEVELSIYDKRGSAYWRNWVCTLNESGQQWDLETFEDWGPWPRLVFEEGGDGRTNDGLYDMNRECGFLFLAFVT
jgi:hypothetical protein